MVATFKKFDLILWSRSQAITLRKLRAFAAPLGGRSHLVHDFAMLQKALGTTSEDTGRHLSESSPASPGSSMRGSDWTDRLVLIDQDTTVTPDQIETLRSRCRLLLIRRDDPAHGPLPTIPTDHQDWGPRMVASGPLPRILESTAGRATLGWVAQGQRTISLDLFLRWGYEARHWGAWDPSLSQSAPRFANAAPPLFAVESHREGRSSAKILKNMGFRTRTSEAVSAVLEEALARLQTSHFAITNATIASDGLMIGSMAEITARGTKNLESIASKITSFADLTIITLRTSPKTWELVLLMPAPQTDASSPIQSAPLIMMLQRGDQTADLALNLSTAI